MTLTSAFNVLVLEFAPLVSRISTPIAGQHQRIMMKLSLTRRCINLCCTRCALLTCIGTLIFNCCLFVALMRMPMRGMPPLVDTPGCFIPFVDPFEPAILSIVQPNVSVALNCSAHRHRLPTESGQTQSQSFEFSSGKGYDLTYHRHDDDYQVDVGFVCINQTVNLTSFAGRVTSCSYFAINRDEKSGAPDYTVRYSEQMRWFEKDGCINLDQVESEFVKVICFDAQMRAVYANYYATIKPKNRTPFTAKATGTPFNVLFLGIDAVSRLNFNRQMPKTSNLLRELGFHEFYGFNKVSANSLLNMVPILAGKYLRDYDPSNSRITRFDDLDIIWKEFRKLGYATLFAEDAPEIAIFNYYKGGFRRQPADHYLRPFSLALESDTTTLWNHAHHCVGERAETRVVLDWLRQFSVAYEKMQVPWFAFAFLTRLTHADPILVRAADQFYFDFFESLRRDAALRHTLVVLFSDHGARFGPLRQTNVGQLEERLPLLFVHLPDSVRHSLSNASLRAFTTNQHRLITPFDLHETLVDLGARTWRMKPSIRSRRFGQSLFTEIGETRTCSSAGIEAQWCACHRTPFSLRDSLAVRRSLSISKSLGLGVSASLSETVVHTAAAHILVHINKVTAGHRSLCANLELQRIVSITAVRSDADQAQYTVVVMTKQEAVFEADVAVQFHNNNPTLTVYRLLGEPEPISRMEPVSYCCTDILVRKYCVCGV